MNRTYIKHDSITPSGPNKYGFEVGMVTPLGKIIHITSCGEVIFDTISEDGGNEWTYDDELNEELNKRLNESRE